jgi:hypothetical protein
MKKEILEVIKLKKMLYNQQRNEAIVELRKLQAESIRDKEKNTLDIIMNKFPEAKLKLISSKIVLAVLQELEQDIVKIDEASIKNI